MAAIRQSLQKEVFNQEEESLVTFIHVTKSGKKPRFLCITTTSDAPIVVKLHEIKYSDSSKPKKKDSWWLRDLKLVDGIHPRKNTPDFDLVFKDDIVTNWVATNFYVKDAFIKQLYQLTNRHLQNNKPEFVNLSLPVDDERNKSGLSDAIISEDEEQVEYDVVTKAEDDGYNLISANDERDFKVLLDQYNLHISQAEQFSNLMANELQNLDEGNVRILLSNDVEIDGLLQLIDMAINEASRLEDKLNEYDSLLQNVRDSVSTMEERDRAMHQETNNKEKLLSEVEKLVTSISLSDEETHALSEAQLDDIVSIAKATKAVHTLENCLKAKVSPGLEKMAVYYEQMQKLSKLGDQFSEKLVTHLLAVFRTLGQQSIIENGEQVELTHLPEHDDQYSALLPYTELVLWLKNSRRESYRSLIQGYEKCFSEVYKSEFSSFFRLLKSSVRSPATADLKTNSLKRNVSSIEKLSLKSVSSPHAVSRLSFDDLRGARHKSFEEVLDYMLTELQPVAASEQKFCMRFFHVVYNAEVLLSVSSLNDSGGQSPAKRAERQTQDELNKLFQHLYQQLDVELQDFVAHCDNVNPFYNMYLLAKIYNHVSKTSASSSTFTKADFISHQLGKAVVFAKRRLDTYMECRIKELHDLKIAKRVRLGILPFLLQFEDLSNEAETAFRLAERRNDIDRWYGQLINVIIETIQRLSEDPNSKSPATVVRMENFHRLYSILSRLKISSLDVQKKDVKQLYHDNLNGYLAEHLRKPLGRLSAFFDDVSQSIAHGLKPDEVSYQMAFNKEELRKVMKEYPGKEVKKGLENLYRMINKHLCEEEGLLQVVWHEFQNKFMAQHKQYQTLVGQCYSHASIKFEFTANDLLQYFSDIAQQH